MMQVKTRVPSLTGLLLVAFLALTGASAGADTVHRSFDVAPGGLLTVASDIGSIKVRTHSEPTVDVEVTRSGDQAEELQLDFSHDGDDVTVKGEFEGRRRFFNWGRDRKVSFVITVPESYNVDLRTKGGSVSVEDLEGEVQAQTSGGSLNFGRIRGPVQGHTSGGSITLEGSVGDAEVSTSGGSIKIGDVDGEVTAKTSGGSISIGRSRGSIEAKTSGGSIRVEEVMGAIQASTSGGSVTAYISEQPKGDCRLTTSGGGVSVYLADGIGVDIDARSSAGRVTSDFPVDAEVETRTVLQGRINGGGPELHLRSSAGGVRVLRK